MTSLIETDRPSIAELDQLERLIQRDLSLRVHNFRLRACDDGLVLEGRTKTYHGKQLVQHAVMDATDFPILANKIVVG
jgi:hypothetical protein